MLSDLKDFKGKIKVISVTPSLDTPVCDLQLHWFNEDAAKQPEKVVVINLSKTIMMFFFIRSRASAFGFLYCVMVQGMKPLG